jgi:DeoR/GlpR family transcriptional regulator of sugar metabolism
VAFVGADGIDEDGNIYNESIEVGRMLERMTAAADRVYVVADSSKIGKTALYRFGQLARWRGLLTDEGIDESMRRRLKREKVNLIVAKPRR